MDNDMYYFVMNPPEEIVTKHSIRLCRRVKGGFPVSIYTEQILAVNKTVMTKWLYRASVFCGLLTVWMMFAVSAPGVSITGADWIVHFNLPDQLSTWNTGSDDEYCLRAALLDHINALQTNHSAWLATYTFSGSNYLAGGAAGPIISALDGALNRGARVFFVVGKEVETSFKFNGTNSLDTLAARSKNPLVLVQDDSSSGIHHNKIGLFDYGASNRWMFVASWNFTAAASSWQWNVGLEVKNNADLFTAYTNEFAELLAGRFHDHPEKRHTHDGTRFRLFDSWGESWVRFSPYPDESYWGTNAMTDIVNSISNAESEIVFSLNILSKPSHPLICDALVEAANRGVMIHGVIPMSDWNDTSNTSYAAYVFLTNSLSYATTNTVHFVIPYKKADYSALDDGEVDDLVHTKYMIIDAWAACPVVIHGSANWTESALLYDDSNDENILFLRHRGIARAFHAQFKRMTGTWTNRNDFWCDMRSVSNKTVVGLWVTDTNRFFLERSTNMSGWTACMNGFTGRVGRTVYETNAPAQIGFFRLRRE